jgi:hypothetical protein
MGQYYLMSTKANEEMETPPLETEIAEAKNYTHEDHEAKS